MRSSVTTDAAGDDAAAAAAADDDGDDDEACGGGGGVDDELCELGALRESDGAEVEQWSRPRADVDDADDDDDAPAAAAPDAVSARREAPNGCGGSKGRASSSMSIAERRERLARERQGCASKQAGRRADMISQREKKKEKKTKRNEADAHAPLLKSRQHTTKRRRSITHRAPRVRCRR